MYEMHTDSQGNKKLIASMDNSHLTNTIKLILKKIKELKSIIENSVTSNDVFTTKVLNYDVEDYKENASRKVKVLIDKLYPYITEASLRGLDTTPELQETFDRKVSLVDYNMNLLDYDPDYEAEF